MSTFLIHINIGHADTLKSWPNPESKFVHWPDMFKNQFIVNSDIDVYDHNNVKMHPIYFSQVFNEGIYCVSDLSMKW